ncbi:MAG: NADH-quinone oxidoreductase subunit N [Bdellovibrionota bacterium]
MSANLLAVMPLVCVTLFAVGMLLYDLFRKADPIFWTLGGCFSGILFYFPQMVLPRELTASALGGLLDVDGFSAFFGTLILLGTILSSLLHYRQAAAQRAVISADVDVLLLLTACGGMVMVSAANLMVFFVGFELLSVCVYVLSGIARHEAASSEGALKYFVLGAFSSAFMLYGITLIYGATGSMDLVTIGHSLAHSYNNMAIVGLGLLLFGFSFKVSLVPFHFWAPDVYQGAPVSISGFMAVVVKAAAFGAFLRVMSQAFIGMTEVWAGLFWTLAALTMTIGNLMALRQRSIKRMLAYSSVAHAGYALMGFLALGPSGGGEAVVFYMLVYMFMTITAFGVVLVVTAGSDAQYARDDLDSLSGIGWSHPALGLVMTVAMLSLAGMPPLSGFMGKLMLFSSVVNAGYVGLAIIAALNSVVSLYYYLGVVVTMYFSGERKLSWRPPTDIPFGPGVALALSTFGTVYFGLFSENCIRLIRLAVKSMG